jgi:hypothetical protein
MFAFLFWTFAFQTKIKMSRLPGQCYFFKRFKHVRPSLDENIILKSTMSHVPARALRIPRKMSQGGGAY